MDNNKAVGQFFGCFFLAMVCAFLYALGVVGQGVGFLGLIIMLGGLGVLKVGESE